MSRLFALIRANPLVSALTVVVVVAGIWIVASVISKHFTHKEEVKIERAEKSGATTERLKANEEVLNNVKDANDAVVNPQPDDIERMRDRFDRARRSDGQ